MADVAYSIHPSRRRDGAPADIDAIIQQIARLPLAAPEIAEAQLAALLETALASAVAAEELFFLLEYVRSPLSFVREAAVRHYHAQAPMLDQDSDAHFQDGIDAWQRMVRAYARCLGAEELGAPVQMPEHVATIIHRCLFYQGLTIFEHYRAKRQLPAGVWRQFHDFYAMAERFASTRAAVKDELFGEIRITDCQAAYIAPLLLSAAKPFGHDSRQLEAIGRWSAQWAHLAAVTVPGADDGNSFILDLGQDSPHQLQCGFVPGGKQRLLDTTGLTAHLRRILELLDRRPPPESFGLSEDNIAWTRPLLAELARAWTPSPESRRYPRLSQRAALRLSVGFDQIHTLIAGRKPSPSAMADADMAAPPGEDWYLVEESRSGCRLVHPAPKVHLQIHQLLALYDQHAGAYRLGQVQWLMQDSLRGIVAGIALFACQPAAVSVRSNRDHSGKGRFLSRAFLLSADGHCARGCLVLPKGIFKADRWIEISNGEDNSLELKEIVQEGADFDHVAFQ